MKRVLVRALRALLLLLLAFYGAAVMSLVYLRFLPPVTTGVQTQRRVESWMSGSDYDKRARWIPIARVPAHVRHAVVAAEDARFFEHRGFDVREMRAAASEARRGGRRRGASTITQQLVKNIYFTTHASVVRKGLEVTITPLAELVLGKDRILELYLNVVEWAPGVYGIHEAARHHYSTTPDRLTRDQAARLAAVLPAPRTRSPQRMGSYAGLIQNRMRQRGW